MMRTRGSYRQYECFTNGTIGSNESIKPEPYQDYEVIEDMDVMEVIDITDEEFIDNSYPNKRQNCDQNSIETELIIIDSDEELEEEDIQLIDSGLDDSRTTVSSFEAKPICLTRKINCNKCLTQITLSTDVNEYNQLTSADFYDNPRIHPSVISIELKDKNRFNRFQESIEKSKHLFANKTVLIIGSGTGLLGLFAAKAMASVVILVDRPGIQEIINLIIEKNRWKLPNHKTKFFTLKITEDFVLPNGLQSVDIIVSDWANHSLYYKSLINVFITIRNKFLKKGGLIYPDSAQLYLAGAHDFIHRHTSKDKRRSDSFFVKRVDYWDKNVYNFDMSAIRQKVILEPLHENINKKQVITNEFRIKTFNLYEITAEDFNFSIPFELNSIKSHYLQTFVLFFEVIFAKHQTVPIMFSTRPSAPRLMFRPTIFFMESDKHLIVNKNDKISGKFTYDLTKDLNQLNVTIDYKMKNSYFDIEDSLNYTTN